jgi:ubiquinone/menaquinone biosynthesis C-methylase UbiE
MLKCIKCNYKISKSIDNFICTNCNNIYLYKHNIILTDTTTDTMLNVNGYIDEKQNDKPIVNFIDFINNLYKEKGKLDALEIASGPGNLTIDVLNTDLINELWSSDISVNFLEYQSKIIKNPNCKFIQFNASNTFPFMNNTLDLVYGNSCLHHFTYYEKSLSECYRVLKPGGIAIFGEPILTGIQPIFLMLSLIAEFDKISQKPIFSNEIYKKIIQFNINNDMLLELANTKQYNKLNNFEDKYQFTIEQLSSLSNKIGFSNFTTLKDINSTSFLYNPSIHTYISQVELFINTILINWKIPSNFLWIIELVYNTIVKPNLGEDYCALFTVFCMKK